MVNIIKNNNNNLQSISLYRCCLKIVTFVTLWPDGLRWRDGWMDS